MKNLKFSNPAFPGPAPFLTLLHSRGRGLSRVGQPEAAQKNRVTAAPSDPCERMLTFGAPSSHDRKATGLPLAFSLYFKRQLEKTWLWGDGNT